MTITFPTSPTALAGQLARIRPRWLLPALIGALVLAVLAFSLLHARAASVRYVAQPIAQQTLVQSVTASGTVNPQNDVSVGTQVSGTIAQIFVDYNSTVKAGQVLAKLDPSTFQAQLDEARAALAQSEAQAAQAGAAAAGAGASVGIASDTSAAQSAAIGAARASVVKAQAELNLAQTTVHRDSALLAQGYLAQSAVDADRATAASDASDVAAAQAAVAQAEAQAQAAAATVGQAGSTAQGQAAAAQAARAAVQAAAANVAQDELNLSHTIITSPVNGTVVARDVSVGQTVAASLQTPTLFSIAQDLHKMEVDINVGEPDIGNVKPGDSVNFTVLAYPSRTFTGTVAQVRINPQTVNNVVTYDVVVLVANLDGKLLPGMTANATVNVATAPNALVVPVAALQWHPNTTHRTVPSNGRSPWGATTSIASGSTPVAGSRARIFVLRAGKPVYIPVKVGLVTTTQAAVTPIAPATLAAGESVVVASSGGAAPKTSSAARSPMGRPPVGGMHGIH